VKDKRSSPSSPTRISPRRPAEWKTRQQSPPDALMQGDVRTGPHTGELIALLWQIDVEPPEMTWIDVRWR